MNRQYYVNVPETKGHSPKLKLPKEPVFKKYESEHLHKPAGGVTNPHASGMINSLRSTVETLEAELKAEKERTKALERAIRAEAKCDGCVHFNVRPFKEPCNL